MKVAELIASLSKLPPDAEAPSTAVVPNALVPKGLKHEDHFIPAWALTGEEAELRLSEAIESTWRRPTIVDLESPTFDTEPQQVDLVSLEWRHHGPTYVRMESAHTLLAGGYGQIASSFVVGPPLSYLDPATRTVVFRRHDPASVVSLDVRHFIEIVHWMVRAHMRAHLLSKSTLRRMRQAEVMTVEEARFALSLPYRDRIRFTLSDKPKLSKSLEAAYKLFADVAENAEILAAYRQAGGSASSAAIVIGRLRGALGATRDSQLLRDGADAALAAVRSTLEDDYPEAADAVAELCEADIVSGMYE